jgi:hypothetical protein
VRASRLRYIEPVMRIAKASAPIVGRLMIPQKPIGSDGREDGWSPLKDAV